MITYLSQNLLVALAVARERLNIAFFDRFWVKMAECRSALCDSIELWKACGRQPQEQKHVIAYAMEFVVAQAHRSIAWRCSEEQLARAQSSSSSSGSGNRAPGSGGMYKQSWELYKEDLQALRLRSTEEAFAAARRIIPSISVSARPSLALGYQFGPTYSGCRRRRKKMLTYMHFSIFLCT